jgi:SH3-like domain-containing protein
MPFRFLPLLTALLLALPALGQTPAPAPATSAGQTQATPPPHRPPVPARPARPAPQAAPAPAPTPATPPPLVVEPGKGSVTGLPIPRYAALRSNEVNLRVGPGTDRPAEWTYRRRELPVEIVSEYQQWRQIRDMDGTVGWVHAATLTGRRTFVVKAAEAMMRRRPEADAAPVARLMPGVVGRIRACAAGAAWCEVQAGEYRGYVLRSGIWGLSAEENVGG